MISRLAALIILGLAIVPMARAASDTDPVSMDEQTAQKRFSLAGALGYISLHNAVTGRSITGATVGILPSYALSKDWAAGVSIGQSFSLSSGNAGVFTAFEAKMLYALTGSLIAEESAVSLGGSRVMKKDDYNLGGLRLSLGLTQYLFNGTVSAIPFTGVAFAGYYEFASRTAQSYFVGLRVDRLGNGTITLTPYQGFFGISFRF